MIQTFEKFILRISNLKVLSLCLFTVVVQGYFLFSRWGSHFKQLTGEKVFDLQPSLTPNQIYEQLPKYTEEAIAVYWKFVALDYLFPVTGALSVVLLLGIMLARGKSAISTKMLKSRVWLIPFGIIPFDWLENTGFIFLVHNFPVKSWNLAQCTCWCKYSKMLFVFLLNGVLIIGLVTFFWERVANRQK